MKQKTALIFFAFLGWTVCGAAIGIGRQLFDMQTTLIIHAFAAPSAFTLLTLLYFKLFNQASPLLTAAFFLFFVLVMDVFVVALLIEKSFSMFTSVLGTWLPFGLIFSATYLTGSVVSKPQCRT